MWHQLLVLWRNLDALVDPKSVTVDGIQQCKHFRSSPKNIVCVYLRMEQDTLLAEHPHFSSVECHAHTRILDKCIMMPQRLVLSL